MAFTVKITGYSNNDDQVLLAMEPEWWNAQDLMKDERFVVSRRTGLYCDYAAELSLDEMKELHSRYIGNVTTIKKWLCFNFTRLSPPCKQLQKALFKQSTKYSRFQVNVYEWDSGL